MEKIQAVLEWFNGLSRKGKAFVVMGTAFVVFVILEGLKS